MEHTIQNIDIPQERSSAVPEPEAKAKSTPPKKINPKILILIILFSIIFVSLLATSLVSQNLPKTTPSAKPVQTGIDTPTPLPRDPVQSQLHDIKNKLNSLEEIPDLNIDEELTF